MPSLFYFITHIIINHYHDCTAKKNYIATKKKNCSSLDFIKNLKPSTDLYMIGGGEASPVHVDMLMMLMGGGGRVRYIQR